MQDISESCLRFEHHWYTHDLLMILALCALSIWSGYQRFLMIMIFNPDSAECQIALDWPRRKQMRFRERFNYEAVIWAYIVFWPLIEVGLFMARATTFATGFKRTKK